MTPISPAPRKVNWVAPLRIVLCLGVAGACLFLSGNYVLTKSREFEREVAVQAACSFVLNEAIAWRTLSVAKEWPDLVRLQPRLGPELNAALTRAAPYKGYLFVYLDRKSSETEPNPAERAVYAYPQAGDGDCYYKTVRRRTLYVRSTASPTALGAILEDDELQRDWRDLSEDAKPKRGLRSLLP